MVEHGGGLWCKIMVGFMFGDDDEGAWWGIMVAWWWEHGGGSWGLGGGSVVGSTWGDHGGVTFPAESFLAATRPSHRTDLDWEPPDGRRAGGHGPQNGLMILGFC